MPKLDSSIAMEKKKGLQQLISLKNEKQKKMGSTQKMRKREGGGWRG